MQSVQFCQCSLSSRQMVGFFFLFFYSQNGVRKYHIDDAFKITVHVHLHFIKQISSRPNTKLKVSLTFQLNWLPLYVFHICGVMIFVITESDWPSPEKFTNIPVRSHGKTRETNYFFKMNGNSEFSSPVNSTIKWKNLVLIVNRFVTA